MMDGGDKKKDRNESQRKKSTEAECQARIHSVLSKCQSKRGGWLNEVIRPERKDAEKHHVTIQQRRNQAEGDKAPLV